jgi:hypothetical protein
LKLYLTNQDQTAKAGNANLERQMALVNCKECSHKISKTATQCPGCGAKIKRTSIVTKILAVILLFPLALALVSQLFSTTNTTDQSVQDSPPSIATQAIASQPESSNPAKISDAMKTYLGAAAGFLITHNAQGEKVAQAMAGANTGATTLTQIKKTIEGARSVTLAGFEGDYLKYGKLLVPDDYAEIDKLIRLSFSQRDAAYEEYLAFFADNNTAHIESASAAFMNSEQSAQKAQTALTAKMKALKK